MLTEHLAKPGAAFDTSPGVLDRTVRLLTLYCVVWPHPTVQDALGGMLNVSSVTGVILLFDM